MGSEGEREHSSKPRVEAVERALSIVEAFADGTPRLTLSALAKRTGHYPSTILRLCNSLQQWGYLQRDADGCFRLGPSLWRLGILYQNSFDLERYVRPVLQLLVAELGETAAFYVKEGNHRICLYRSYAKGAFGHHVEEGARLPLDVGASAHVLMAFNGAAGEKYERIRLDHFHVSHGERMRDAVAVAAPVLGTNNDLVGALSVIGPNHRMKNDTLTGCIKLIKESAIELSRTLQGR
jgi:DNA-binding IclR family transcriptional regulator